MMVISTSPIMFYSASYEYTVLHKLAFMNAEEIQRIRLHFITNVTRTSAHNLANQCFL